MHSAGGPPRAPEVCPFAFPPAQARNLALTIGSGAPVLIAMVRFPIPGSELLLLQMLLVLTEEKAPPPALVAVIMEVYQINGDARFLSPALAGLPKARNTSHPPLSPPFLPCLPPVPPTPSLPPASRKDCRKATERSVKTEPLPYIHPGQTCSWAVKCFVKEKHS